jgi:hypothetical protein
MSFPLSEKLSFFIEPELKCQLAKEAVPNQYKAIQPLSALCKVGIKF